MMSIQTLLFALALLLLTTTLHGFWVSPPPSCRPASTTTALPVSTTTLPFFVDQDDDPQARLYTPRPPKSAPPLHLVMMRQRQQRGSQTSLWQTWQEAVAQADVHIGTRILQGVFDQAANGNGHMTVEGLQTALSSGGAFAMLDADHIQGIYDRAAAADGKRHKGYVTLDEWLAESTQTLRG